MALLGLSLVAAAGLSFWAGMDSWATLYGVVLKIVSLVVRMAAHLPELLVVALRRAAHLVMAGIDLPLLGAAYPLLRWWASSKFGKALGFPPLEEPIPWPAVGYVELPPERPLPGVNAEPLGLVSAKAMEVGDDDEGDGLMDFEEAA